METVSLSKEKSPEEIQGKEVKKIKSLSITGITIRIAMDRRQEDEEGKKIGKPPKDKVIIKAKEMRDPITRDLDKKDPKLKDFRDYIYSLI